VSFTDQQSVMQPDNDAPVWRYMSIEKYLSLLASDTLFFPSADLMPDRWEGYKGKATEEARRKRLGDNYEAVLPLLTQSSGNRKSTYLSCWYVGDSEDAVMWYAYARENGVALKTTWGKLKQSVASSTEALVGGFVEYINPDVDPVSDDTPHRAYFFKRQHFRSEREARLVYQLLWYGTRLRKDSDPAPVGVDVSWDRSVLDAAVYTAPGSPSFTTNALKVVTGGFTNWTVQASELFSEPV
jgi:hypothetical protein